MGGAIYLKEDAVDDGTYFPAMAVQMSTFAKNRAGDAGAVIAQAPESTMPLAFRWSIAWGNFAPQGSFIQSNSTRLTVVDNIIQDTFADDDNFDPFEDPTWNNISSNPFFVNYRNNDSICCPTAQRSTVESTAPLLTSI